MTTQIKKIRLFTTFLLPVLICSSSYADAMPDAISADAMPDAISADAMPDTISANVMPDAINLYRRFDDYTYVKANFGAIVDSTKMRSINYPLLSDSGFKSAPVYSIGAGYNYEGPFRTDIDVQYRQLRYKRSDGTGSVKQGTKNLAVFWNGYIDGENDSIVTPYVTGGVGYSRLFSGPAYLTSNSGSTAYFKGKVTNNFAWNVGAGAKVKITDNAELDLTYRFVTLGKVGFANSPAFGGTPAGKPFMLRTHEITMGLVYNF